MKTKLLTAIFAGAMLAFGSLSANSVYLIRGDYDGVPYAKGGEFIANSSTLGGTFITFCLESNVHIDLPGTYNYTIETQALMQGDTLSVGAAWLFEEFYKGTLSGSNSASYFDLANRDLNAGLLQKAFWYLENESKGSTNYYTSLAISHFGSLANAQADITNTSKVKVLNLWGPNGEDVQSVLVYVPDSGMTVALLGLGLLSVLSFRRKTVR